MGIWSQETSLRLDLNIWYPALRQAQELHFGIWTITGALNAKPAPGSFPLIILSHASPGGRFSYASLASAMASRGFVVAAPHHQRDCIDNMDDLFTWNQLKTRAEQISRVADILLENKEFGAIIDSEQIGVIGFGAGAASALLLGGAEPNCTRWPAYCEQAASFDPYCDKRAREKIDAVCKNFPLRRSIKDKRVKAIAAIAPGFGMFFSDSSFRSFDTPLLIVIAGNDHFNHPQFHSESIARMLGSKARRLVLPSADAGALMDKCPASLFEAVPELCGSADDAGRRKLRVVLENSLLSFFSHYLSVQNIKKPI